MPESEKTAHYFFANPHNIPGDAESITEQINASVHQAFAEDYAIISAQLRNPADREHSFWLNVNTDSGSS